MYRKSTIVGLATSLAFTAGASLTTYNLAPSKPASLPSKPAPSTAPSTTTTTTSTTLNGDCTTDAECEAMYPLREADIIKELNGYVSNATGYPYQPLQVMPDRIIVDCQHPAIFCDDEGA